MAALAFRLVEDVLPPGAPVAYLPGAERALYVVEGDVTVEFREGAQNHAAGSAWIGAGPLGLLAGAKGVRLWRWEIAPPGTEDAAPLASAPQARSELKLSADLDLDPRQEWLMRCDRVGFPPGGVALTHVHQGPGIRCCLTGEITIETQGERGVHGPGQAWLEIGHAPVLAPTTEREETVFIRCFLLPRACRGRSSIRYVRESDAAAPKVQEYFVFAERFISLAA